jgi:hypothetical protein
LAGPDSDKPRSWVCWKTRHLKNISAKKGDNRKNGDEPEKANKEQEME